MERLRIALPTGELRNTVVSYVQERARIFFDRPNDYVSRRYLHAMLGVSPLGEPPC